eukprot:679085_1
MAAGYLSGGSNTSSVLSINSIPYMLAAHIRCADTNCSIDLEFHEYYFRRQNQRFRSLSCHSLSGCHSLLQINIVYNRLPMPSNPSSYLPH